MRRAGIQRKIQPSRNLSWENKFIWRGSYSEKQNKALCLYWILTQPSRRAQAQVRQSKQNHHCEQSEGQKRLSEYGWIRLDKISLISFSLIRVGFRDLCTSKISTS